MLAYLVAEMSSRFIIKFDDVKRLTKVSDVQNNNINLTNILNKIGNYRKVGRNQEVYDQDCCGEYYFRVLHGAVRTVSFFEDGRRQVGAFCLPGEFFGFDVSGGSFSAEAVVDTEYIFVRRVEVMELSHTCLALTTELLARTTEALHLTQEHLLLLGRQTAEERLESFLIDMACRIGDGNSVDLPMDRRDIADYLALAIETVSRTFAELERKKRIETPSSRRIKLTGSLLDPLRPGVCTQDRPSTRNDPTAAILGSESTKGFRIPRQHRESITADRVGAK